MKYYISLILFLLLGYSSLYGQRLTSTQISKNFSNLKVPENKSIIVFESDLDLSFTSSMEKLEPPVKKENIYFLTVSERICIIKVTNNVSKSDVELPFGQLSDKTLPIIKKGEYLVFKIEENQKELIVLNQTEVKKGEGLNDNQMLYDKEALLILNVDPFDLEIELESSQPITEIKHTGKQYKVYIKPIKQVIIVKQKGSDVQGNINIIQIEPKEVLYYYISLPEQLRKREVIYDKSISVGDYLIESVPSGAVIEIFGNPSFNAEKNKTPFLLKGFETGFKVVTLTLQEYETIKDTIQIGSSKKNKSNYNLVPQFAFINIKVEPQFPYSSLFIDNQLYYAQNVTDIKIPVSSKEVEIRAPHFESEKIEITPIPGEVISITKTMKPIMGKLYLVCGENAENGKVYITNTQLNIDKKLIGILPIKDTLILQEGQYDLIVEKEGFGTLYDNININKNKDNSMKIDLFNLKSIVINTNEKNAEIFIDGHYIGKSNIKYKIPIGEHRIEVIHKNFNTYKGIIVLNENDNDGKVFNIEIEPILFNFQIELMDHDNNYTIYLDEKKIGYGSFEGKIRKGVSKITVKSKYFTVYKSKIRISKDKKLKLPIYYPLNFSLINLGANEGSVFSLSFHGLYIHTYKAINYFDSLNTLSGFLIPEIKIGGAISNNIDISLSCIFNHDSFKFNSEKMNLFTSVIIDLNQNWLKPSDLLKVNIFLRVGFLSNYNYKKIKYPIFSFGFSMDICRSSILRLWHKPFFISSIKSNSNIKKR